MSVDGVILAGGRSERFGSDKCFARWGERSFLASVAATLAPRVDALLVLSRHGADPAPYAREAPGARVLPDAAPGAGPVAALRDALPFLGAPVVAVVGCDAPGLAPATFESLVGLARRAPAVVEADGRALHAVFAMPREGLAARAGMARRLADLTHGAARVGASGPGLNVNQWPFVASS